MDNIAVLPGSKRFPGRLVLVWAEGRLFMQGGYFDKFFLAGGLQISARYGMIAKGIYSAGLAAVQLSLGRR